LLQDGPRGCTSPSFPIGKLGVKELGGGRQLD
jgi:hypothetical protein